MSYDFSNLSATSVSKQILTKCASLFSRNYGVWGPNGKNPGKPVKMSGDLLRAQCLFDSSCRLVTVRQGTELNCSSILSSVSIYSCR